MSLADIAADIELLATVAGIVVIACAGLMLITSKNPVTRDQWKEVILGVVIGLCVVFIAPIIGSLLSGGHYCG